MINPTKLSILLLVSAFSYLPHVHGMWLQERIAQAQQEQKEERDAFEAFIVLDQNFEEIARGGSIAHKFADVFKGLDGKEPRFAKQDNIKLLKDACAKAKEGKAIKLIVVDKPFDFRVKVFALCGKNKTHFAVKISESQHFDFLPDGLVLK